MKAFERKELLDWFLKTDLEFNDQRLGLVSDVKSPLCIGSVLQGNRGKWLVHCGWIWVGSRAGGVGWRCRRTLEIVVRSLDLCWQ